MPMNKLCCTAVLSQNCCRLTVNNLEKPIYKVSKTIRLHGIKAELREYEPYMIAESTVTGDTMKDATSKGFMNVARYTVTLLR